MTKQSDVRNAYDILGVPRHADVAAIRRAYRLLALQHHPDRAPPHARQEAAIAFAPINQAYALLCDASQRRRYDSRLDRGIIPDLDKEIGAVPLPALGEILGQIQSLNVPPAKEHMDCLPVELRDYLQGQLIHSPDIHESVVDLLPVVMARWPFMPPIFHSRGAKIPEGEYQGGWLLVTELRLILVALGGSRWQLLRSIYYTDLKKMLLHQRGRAMKKYELELEDEQGAWFRLKLFAPRLHRLFLIANAYQLPLRIQSRDERFITYVKAITISLTVPALVWGAAALIFALLRISEVGIFSAWIKKGLPLGMIYATPLLFIILFLWSFRALHLRRGRQVFGPLPVDYAEGMPEASPAPEESAPPATPSTRHKNSPPPQDEPTTPPVAEGPAAVEQEESAYDRFVRQRGEIIASAPPHKKSPPLQGEPPSPTVSEGPAVVDMPDAVREALRREKPPE